MIDLTNLSGVLVWMTGIGAVTVANWLFGKVLSGIPAWNGLPSEVKWAIPPIFAVILGVGSTFLLQRQDIVAVVAPYFTLIMTILLGYFGSQTAHLQTKALAKPTVIIMASGMTVAGAEEAPPEVAQVVGP